MATIQQIVLKGRQDEFEAEVNRLLLDGWRVVPGTFAVGTVEQVAAENAPPKYVTVGGTSFWSRYFITLELGEAS